MGGILLPLAAPLAQVRQRQSLSTDDGLPQNSVHAVLQTRDGFLWAATEGGVVRFDGVRFATFTTATEHAFTSNDACCLAQTADGALWIGTSDGLVRWVAGRFDHLDTGPVLAMVAEGSGALLVLTPDGVESIRGLQKQPLRLPDDLQATALGTARDGSALLAAGAVLLRVQAGAVERAGTLPASPADLLEGDDGTVWLRTGTAVWASARGGWRQWRIGTDVPGSRLLSLSRTAGGAVLAGTNRGVYTLHADDAAAAAVPEMEDTTVLSATTDAEGDAWFGTDTTGLVVLRQRPVASLPALSTDTVTSIVQSGETLWIGTRDSGLKQLRDGVVSTPPAAHALSSQAILSLAPAADGSLWIGTLNGLYRLRQGGLQHLTSSDGLPDDFIRSLYAEGTDGVWVGTRHGAAHLAVNRVDRLLTTADGLPSDVVGTMLRDRGGALWIGTLHGLARLQGAALAAVPLAGAPALDGVTALAEAADGTVLVGTHSGSVGLVNGGLSRTVRVAGVDGEIDALLPDDAGNIWIRIATGIVRVRLDGLLRCPQICALPHRHYGTADGMPSVDLSSDGHPSAWRDPQGTLWFATRRGVARIEAAYLPVDRVPPPVTLERVQVDGVSLDMAAPLRVGPGHRRFVFDYAGLSLRAPLQVLYRFRLEGFDRDWTDAGNARSAEYTNLPAGDYRFLVEARNADGVASTEPAVLDLHIAAPFYRRPWFYLLLVALAAAVVYGLYRLRLRRVQGEFNAVLNERNRIAREIHDTLAQDFVAVSLQLEVTSQLLRMKATDAAQEQIDTTRQLVRDGIRDARESIWALRAGEAAAGLPARLQALAQADGAPPLTVNITGAYRALAPSMEKELLRIAKEAVGNARHHAAAATLSADLVYLEDAVVLTVRDDGAGFDVDGGLARTGHYGLRGMSERAAAMGAICTITSAPGQGTTVNVRLNV